MMRTMISKELREQQRTFRLWITAGVLLVSGMISPLLAKYTPQLIRSLPGVPAGLAEIIPEPTLLDSFTQYVKNVSQFGLIVIIVLNMGLVVQEIERGTAAMLLTKPVRRWAVIAAKWLAAAGGIAFGLALAALGFTFYTLVLFGPFSPGNFLALNLLLGVFMLFYLSLALLASTLARSQAMAAAGAFGGLVIILILDALPGIGSYLPSQLIAWGVSLFSGTVQSAWPALAVCLGLSGLFLGMALWRFQKEEI